MFHCCSCFNLEAKLSLDVLAGTTAVILVLKKHHARETTLWNIFGWHVTHNRRHSSTKSTWTSLFYPVWRSTISLFSENDRSSLWGKVRGASLGTLGINETLHCWSSLLHHRLSARKRNLKALWSLVFFTRYVMLFMHFFFFWQFIRSAERCLNGFKSGSQLGQAEVPSTPDQFFIRYISVFCCINFAFPGPWPVSPSQPLANTTTAWGCCRHHVVVVPARLWKLMVFL